jgi:hypothetical protein
MDTKLKNHLVGLLLGTENDWPTAFEALIRAMGPVQDSRGTTHSIETERVTIEPFNLRDLPRHSLVIDRLAYWYYVPREWLKKISLMDDVYLLNSPFTFQSMEKHSAYCAMMRSRTRTRWTTHGGRTRPRSTTDPSTSPRSPVSSATRST